MESVIDLGFLEPCEEPDLLINIHFPSKVGGRPAWLDLDKVPRPEDLKCDSCEEQCVFLLQVYASLEKPDAFHRTIYLFVCPKDICCTIKAFRNQIPRKNQFYDYHPVPENSDAAEAKHNFKLCAICGCRGPFNCAKCGVESYCSKGHQKIDWRMGHKDNCGTQMDHSTACSLVQFPEFEIVLEPEQTEKPSKEVPDQEHKLQQELGELKKLESSGRATMQHLPDNELSRYATEADEDKFFSKFRAAIAAEPEQILRYDREGSPLWIAQSNRLASADVPACEHCNGDRVFEFQVMPQLLNSLKSDTLDWGVLAVYTCRESCGSDGKYLREFVHRQVIESEPINCHVSSEDEECGD